MNKVFIISISVLVSFAICSAPVIMISAGHHEAVLNSNELIQYVSANSKINLVQILNLPADNIQMLKDTFKNINLEKQRVSSFLMQQQKLGELNNQIQDIKKIKKQSLTLQQIIMLIQQRQSDLIITFGPQHTSRILEGVSSVDGTVDSKIFDSLTRYSLSGLLVSLFLLVMLCIGISCLYDLKTNDRFARQNLWVGRES